MVLIYHNNKLLDDLKSVRIAEFQLYESNVCRVGQNKLEMSALNVNTQHASHSEIFRTGETGKLSAGVSITYNPATSV
jgi:hypothetical protein